MVARAVFGCQRQKRPRFRYLDEMLYRKLARIRVMRVVRDSNSTIGRSTRSLKPEKEAVRERIPRSAYHNLLLGDEKSSCDVVPEFVTLRFRCARPMRPLPLSAGAGSVEFNTLIPSGVDNLSLCQKGETATEG